VPRQGRGLDPLPDGPLRLWQRGKQRAAVAPIASCRIGRADNLEALQ
jgi:hypothetical protein